MLAYKFLSTSALGLVIIPKEIGSVYEYSSVSLM